MDEEEANEIMEYTGGAFQSIDAEDEMGELFFDNGKYNLFLDDVRSPAGAFIHTSNPYYLDRVWIIVRSYDDFVKRIVDRGLPEIVSFDHDLADVHYDPSTWTEGFVYHEKTGMDCAKWLVNHCLDTGKQFPKWYVHSQNPVGGKNIKALIENYLKHCESK